MTHRSAPVLARLPGRTAWLLAALAIACAMGCAGRDPAPVTPARPLPADPEIRVDTMKNECDGMLAALAAYKTCPNLEAEDRENLDAWIEVATRDFAASRKANPEPNAQKAIAGACHKATESVKAAAERCAAGPRPKVD